MKTNFKWLGWPDASTPSFQDYGDIPDWASEAVSAAVHAGVISGYPDNTFRAEANINRMETAVMIAKASGLGMPDGPKMPFADEAVIAGWALPYIDAAREAGLIQGQADNRFQPEIPTTRAEAVVLLLRLSSHMS